MSDINYTFTNNWFQESREIWDLLLPQINPTKILEIGSYEGASSCYLIEKIASIKKLELHCIDTWEGSLEHKVGGFAETDMQEVEKRFHNNISVALSKVQNEVALTLHKSFSVQALSKLLSDGFDGYFDFIYVDGSHCAPDVLCDAVLSFRLLKTNGVIAFDDYLWNEKLSYGIDPIRSPKLAIDAFTNIYCRKVSIIRAPLSQLYIQKLTD